MGDEVISMTCMTTKKKFDAVNPMVVVLANGRYAYREVCPWKGKNDKELVAFKFCGVEAFRRYTARSIADEEIDENKDPQTEK